MLRRRRTNNSRVPLTPLPDRRLLLLVRRRIRRWANSHGRHFPWRETSDEYQIAVTELLLQQTTAKSVLNVYSQFFGKFPSWERLAQANIREITCVISPLGLSNQRAQRLRDMAEWAVSHGGQLPRTRAAMESVPGIGQYVANCVHAMCRNGRSPLLDVNMARVIERLWGPRELADLRDDPWLQTLSRRVFPGKHNGWAVLDFANAICRPKPNCGRCPLNDICLWASANQPQPA